MFVHNGLMMPTVEESDLERMRALRNDPFTWTHLTDATLIDAEAQHEWFRGLQKFADRKYLVLFDSDHDFIGGARMVQIDRLNRSILVGTDIVCGLRGRGHGRKALELLKRDCFDFLNMHRVSLLVLDSNDKARRLYERQGFKVEGRYREAVFCDGRYQDYVVLSVLEQEYRAAAGEYTPGEAPEPA
jgi:RimJ/RimL family protein N-acetyltransferase